MTDIEYCTKCEKDVSITYDYEECGDAESGPCLRIVDVVIECGCCPTDIKGYV